MCVVALFDADRSPLKKDFETLPVSGMHKKRGQAIDGVGHAGFEREDGQFVLTVQHAQFAVSLGFNVDVVAGLEGVVRGV